MWRELRVSLPLCVSIAAFLSFVFGDSFWHNLVYSLCIGISIQALIEAGRFTMSARLRRTRPDDPALQNNWPGWARMAPWVLFGTVVGYAFGTWLADLITGQQHSHLFTSPNPRSLAIVLMISLGVSLAATYYFYSHGRLTAMVGQAEAARRSAVETELKLLQSQLEPHMLFNTLANLRVLIGLDPLQAQAMLDHLIAFLRATLAASRSSSHTLAAEFDRTADYLALMAVRMGPRLAVTLDLPDELRDLPVPPLLLQPLVENSIQHGLEPKIEGGRIEVRARRVGDQLRLSVSDSGVGLDAAAPSQGAGFGTTQVRERLAALFGTRASLALQRAPEGGTVAELILPLTP